VLSRNRNREEITVKWMKNARSCRGDIALYYQLHRYYLMPCFSSFNHFDRESKKEMSIYFYWKENTWPWMADESLRSSFPSNVFSSCGQSSGKRELMVFYKEKALHYKIPSISFIKEKYLFFLGRAIICMADDDHRLKTTSSSITSAVCNLFSLTSTFYTTSRIQKYLHKKKRKSFLSIHVYPRPKINTPYRANNNHKVDRY
jgi:hypothetical protein